MIHYNINKTQYRVRDFISWQKNGSLETSPSFQRRPVWNKISKSFLIDTVVKGLPVPIIFLREKITSPDSLEPIREVVDGQQRLRTIFSFVNKSLLNDFNSETDAFKVRKSHNKELADKEFFELDDKYKKRILDYEFSVHVLSADVDDREVLQIFSRMNSTGVKLNHQEIRNAEYVGEFKNSVYETSFKQLYNWKKWGIFTDNNISRMYEVEFVSQLYMLVLNGVEAKSQSKITSTYELYEEEFKERFVLEKRVDYIITMIDENVADLGKTCFSNQSFFYVLFALLYDKAYGLKSKLDKRPAQKISQKWFAKIPEVSRKVNEDSVPAKLLELFDGRRLNSITFRKSFFKYLDKEIF